MSTLEWETNEKSSLINEFVPQVLWAEMAKPRDTCSGQNQAIPNHRSTTVDHSYLPTKSAIGSYIEKNTTKFRFQTGVNLALGGWGPELALVVHGVRLGTMSREDSVLRMM